MARPKTGVTPQQRLRIPQPDWDDFRKLLGRRAPSVIRDFIRWYLRRPGAKMPTRPAVDEIVTALTETETLADE